MTTSAPAPNTPPWPALDLRLSCLSHGALTAEDRLAIALDDLEPTAVEELPSTAATTTAWRVHFRSLAVRDLAIAILRASPALQPIDIDPVDLPDEGWATRTQAALRAVRVGRVTVAPPWDRPPLADPSISIVINPSMGFGTGHHASTRLCLAALQRLDLAGRTVLDIGTGSGVLAFAASRLGAAHVTAIDTDPDALESARENLALNGLVGHVDLRHADLRAFVHPPAAVVVMNLTGWLLARCAAEATRLVAPGGHLVASGFLVEEEPHVRSAFAPLMPLVAASRDGEWSAGCWRRAMTNGERDGR